MKKRHPNLPEQLRGKLGFHWRKAAEGKLNCFGWERCPKILHQPLLAAHVQAGWCLCCPSVPFFHALTTVLEAPRGWGGGRLLGMFLELSKGGLSKVFGIVEGGKGME